MYILIILDVWGILAVYDVLDLTAQFISFRGIFVILEGFRLF